MAKLKDLAGLAALGAIGYKLAQDRDNTTAAAYPTGVMGGARTPVASDSMMDQGDGSVVPRPGQSTITGSQVNPDADTGDTSDYGNEGMRPMSPAVQPKTKSIQSKPQKKLSQTKVNPRLDVGGRSASLAEIERRVAARDEDARLGNIKAAKDYNRGREMESQVLNNMITNPPMKKGGVVKKMAKGGMSSVASSASKRADGIASKGKTKCKMY